MKRKLFNAALFGAVLVAAPVSTFVSCADYETDIQNVQDNLNKEVQTLNELVNQKETALKQQISALEAQDKVLADKLADLEKAQKDCKDECKAALDQCKADCAAARAQLKAAIDELKAALAAAEQKHADDVASLLAADGELNKGIEKANADIESLKGRLDKLEGQVGTLATDVEALKPLKDEVATLKERINEIESKMVSKDYVDKQIADVVESIGRAKAELTGVIEENKKLLEDRIKLVEDDVADLKAKNADLAAKVEDLLGRVKDLEEGAVLTRQDIMALQAGLHDLQTDVIALEGKVDANTAAILANVKAIADNALRIIAAEDAFKAYQLAQEAVDTAQDAALAAVIAELVTEDGTYNFTNINEAYKAALDYAKAAADAVQEYAEGLDERLSVVEDGLAETQKDVFNLTEGLRQVALQADENTRKIAEVEEAYKAADAKMAADFREWIETELNPAFAALYTYVDNLGKDLSSEVKGFVLEPASYYEGIQAIEGTSYEYSKWDVSNELNPVQGTDVTKYCPEVTAHYHINPTSAVLSSDVAQYNYAVLDRDNRAGVNTLLQPQITRVAQNGGMLDVTMRLGNPDANKTPQGHQDPSEVTVMALQYTNPAAKAENAVVTSDYAVLYLNPLQEVALVDATDGHDLGDKASIAEKDYVAYNVETPYDIQAEIKTAFGDEDPLSISDAKWPEGFTYRYTAVAGDVTYFTAITADGKVMPQLPNGQPATTACVGKSATWRIDVMHGEEVAEVGFYTLTITGEAVIETAPAVVTEEILTVTCDETTEALNVNLSIDNVWNLIAQTTGEELAVVKTKYAVSKNTEGNVEQFTEYEGEGNVYYKGYAGKGVVTLNEDGKVNWTILHNDPAIAEDLQSLTKDVKVLKTYIRVRSLDAVSKDTYNEFYLPLVWTPKPIEFWGEFQEVSWTYERVSNQWQPNGLTRQEAELILYTDLTDPNVSFTYDIPAKAMKGEMHTALIGTAKDFVNVAEFELTGGHFRFIEHPVVNARYMTFVEEDGIESTYELVPSEDGSKLYARTGRATDVVIATITPEGVINLVNNAMSQKLLNAYEKDQLNYGETLCARVGYEVECCAGEVKVVDGDFDVRFIKPLTVDVKPITISDADDVNEAGIFEKTILDNIFCFNGYTLAERPNYFDLYGVGIDLGTVADWKTNYDAAEDDFSKTLGENGIATLFGKDETKGSVIYRNNTAVVSKFTVRVPVKVTHKWNAQPVETVVELTIDRTRDNSNRR